MIQNGPGYRHAKTCLVHLEAMLKKIEENMNEAGWELPPVTLCQLGQPSVKLCQVSMRKPFKRCDLEYLVHPQCCDHPRATAAAFFGHGTGTSASPQCLSFMRSWILNRCDNAASQSIDRCNLADVVASQCFYIYIYPSLYLQYIYI